MNKYQEADTLGGRFVSEFGMEAYPHLQTISRMVTDPSQRRPGSMAMDFHNKAINHERRLITYIAENFQLDYDLGVFTHLSQMVQAECMRAAYKAWRRDWGTPGERGCGGVLVWQLNDCWPTMSWAVVDYYLVRKPAWYAMKRALQPLDIGVKRKYHDWTQTGEWVDKNSGLVTGQVDHTLAARDISFDVWIASSRVEPVEVLVTVRFISVVSGRDVAEPIETKETAVANSTTEIIAGEAAPPAIPNAGDPSIPFDVTKYDPYVIHATLTVAGEVVAKDTAWPDPIKYLNMSDRNIRFDVVGDSRLIVTADKPVKGLVFEEVEGMEISDNGFDVMPGDKHIVECLAGPVPCREFRWTCIGAGKASLPIPTAT
jgi:beta-mannosidase